MKTTALDDGSVHIWKGDLDVCPERLLVLQSHLDSLELARASQFAREENRRLFIASRGTLREILSSCIGILPSELAIATNPHGKPYLPDYPHWHFNVSHSQNLAVWAVAHGREVGVDIEQLRPEIPLETLVPRVLSEHEQSLLCESSGDATPNFLHFWTIKEAFLKAVGAGLSEPLHKIEIAELNPNWCARALTTFPHCVASVVARGHDWRVIEHEL